MNGTPLNKRHEILFLYDVSYANPNGDPLDENRPRYDEETGRIYVRDARLKRTIRDTLAEMGETIFVIEERDEAGNLKTKEKKVSELGGKENLLDSCIDIRLFGGTFALKSKNKGGEEGERAFSLTGPVQFKYGRSLHRVKILNIRGTTVMPSSEYKRQGTMLDDYRVAYALIAFYGVANQKVANHTKLTDEDFEKMLKAMWTGHRSGSVLLTSSKIGHTSRLLIDIVHKGDSLSLIGNLDMLLDIKTEKEDEEIRSVEDYTLSLNRLADKIEKFKDVIEKVRYICDDDLRLEEALETLLEGITKERLSFR